MELQVASRCETGPVRENNQDSLFMAHNKYVGVFVVADGMGGYSGGEIASECMVRCVEKWWERQDPLVVKNNRQEAVRRLVDELRETSNELLEGFRERGMTGGTTVCLLMLFGDTYTTLTVGDSRVYKLDDKEMKQLTVDDVWENLPEVKAQYSKEEILKDTRVGKLSMAAGFNKDIAVRISQGITKKGDTFLVCTDGVYRFCTKEFMYKSLKKKSILGKTASVSKMVEKIEEEILANGARDNYSVIVCKVE